MVQDTVVIGIILYLLKPGRIHQKTKMRRKGRVRVSITKKIPCSFIY